MYQQKCHKSNVLKIVSDYFDRLPFEICNKTICVCLSGGADSVALLRACIYLKDKYSFKITACHFNHCIRGNEADFDELFCKKLCDQLGIEIFLGRDDVVSYSKLHKKSIEEAARECRYAFFSRILSKNSIDFCATAHNMNDDAETLLLNLIRGSGSNGATSIEPYNEHYLRPFLLVKRSDIEAFLSEIHQDFVNDSTNASNDYTRNYIRNNVIPMLENINPSVTEAFSRFINSNRVDRDYFEQQISEFDNCDLRELHSALRSRIILRKYKEFSGKILNASVLNEIDKALMTEKRCVLPIFSDDEAVTDNGRIIFKNRVKQPTVFANQKLQLGQNEIFDNNVIVVIDNDFTDGSKYLVSKDLICKNRICGNIIVRQRQTGDKITIKGTNKSLKKLFIDNKIPKEYRNIIPIFCDDEGIIYVPFVGIADRVFSKNSNDLKITTVFTTIDKERWSLSYEE